MRSKWIALAAMVALLSACAATPVHVTEAQPWNGGVWNSVLGYIGPNNIMVTN